MCTFSLEYREHTGTSRLLTPSLASPKNSLTSASFAGLAIRMKIVHGFRAGRLLVGVLAPVLSVAGEVTPSSVLPSEVAAG